MSMTVAQLEAAKARFGELLVEQDKRIERMKAQGDFINYAKLDKIIIGVCGGDGMLLVERGHRTEDAMTK